MNVFNVKQCLFCDLQDDGNVPMTNIDDVTISIIDEDTEKHQRETPEKHRTDKADSVKGHHKGAVQNDTNKRDSQKQRDNTKPHQHQKTDHSRGESQKSRSSESEHRKSDITRNRHESEAIHIHMGRADSSKDSRAPSSQESSHKRDSTSKLPDMGERPAPNPHLQHLQAQSNVKRTGSFQKRSESQRRRSMEHLGGSENDLSDPQNRALAGSQSGTLSDLKKQRAEQHKFGSTDGMVANLFLQSLSGDSKKYSTGSASSAQPQPSVKDKAQNGRASTKPNINNNTTSGGQQRPPTFISDNGPLRKFSAPSSAPVIGEDDKFKNDCCVIL